MMDDRVAVMRMGELQQFDTPQHLYDEPFDMFVASFIGTPPMNLVEADIAVEGDRGRREGRADHDHGRAVGPRALPPVRNCNGRKVVLGIRAEDLHPRRRPTGLPDVSTRASTWSRRSARA